MGFRAWISKILLGYDLEGLQRKVTENTLMLDVISSQTASLAELLAEITPYPKEWPEAASKAILSLDERVQVLTEALVSHRKLIEDILDKPNSWDVKTKNNLN